MVNTGLLQASDVVSTIQNSITTTLFWPISGSIGGNSTEANEQTVIRDAGTFHDMSLRITANTSTAGTWTFRKNGSNGNQTLNITTTGFLHDTTHTDTTVATDKVNYTTNVATSGPATIRLSSILFNSTTNFSTRQVTTPSAAATALYATGTDFNGICGQIATNASNETGVNTTLQKAGTMAHGLAITSANAKTATMTIQSRKNAANGNIAVTVATTSTGSVNEDTTHTDSLVATDKWCTEFVAGTDTTNNATFTLIAQDFETSSGNIFLVEAGADADVSGTSGGTRFVPLGGRFAFNTSETSAQSNALANFTFSNMTINHSGTTASNTQTITFRKNGANGNQTITGGTAVNVYTDSTHTDTVIPTDNVNYQFVFGSLTQAAFSKCYVFGTFTATINQTVLVEWEE